MTFEKAKLKYISNLLFSTFFIFTVFQMAAVTMGFGDPLSPLQSVNRLLNLFSLFAFLLKRTVTLLWLATLASIIAKAADQRTHISKEDMVFNIIIMRDQFLHTLFLLNSVWLMKLCLYAHCTISEEMPGSTSTSGNSCWCVFFVCLFYTESDLY